MRQSWTPCQSGRASTTTRSRRGSCAVAKNVPENMYIGMITKRKTVLIFRGKRTPTAHAAAGAANAIPVRSAAGSTASAHQPSETPNAAMTATKAALEVSTRKAMNSRCPPRISDGSSGVVAAARYGPAQAAAIATRPSPR